MPDRIVLSLCDRTGNAVRPWADAGFECWIVDIQHPPGIGPVQDGIRKVGWDVCTINYPRTIFEPVGGIGFVFAFPPCTHLAASGARWFKDKGLEKLQEAISTVAACKRICEESRAPYLIENPVGVLSTYWRKPDHLFDPCDYAGYLSDPSEDAYTKKTCLWTGGGFVMPEPRRVDPVLGSKMHRLSESKGRGDLRSVTPRGFAAAVFAANRHHLETVVHA